MTICHHSSQVHKYVPVLLSTGASYCAILQIPLLLLLLDDDDDDDDGADDDALGSEYMNFKDELRGSLDSISPIAS